MAGAAVTVVEAEWASGVLVKVRCVGTGMEMMGREACEERCFEIETEELRA